MDRPSLARALESVAMQTCDAVEVVIVNALGRTHGTFPTACGRFAVAVAAAETGGPLRRAQAANRGLAAASGSLALFLDDDDLLLPGHLQKLVEAMQREPSAPAAFSDVEMGRFSDDQWLPLHCFDAAFDATRLLFENYLPIHAVMFRRTGSPGERRFDEAFDLFEDWDFWLQLAALGTFVHVPGLSARYCVTDTEQSDVFADSPATGAARARLFDKWQPQISPMQHRELLSRLQTLFREAPQLRAQFAMAQVTSGNLNAVVVAREHELADIQAQQTQLRTVLAARERELFDAHEHAANLQAIAVERERDATASADHANELLKRLNAREQDLGNALAHATGLEAMVLARDRDSTEALAHAGRLAAILAARDNDIGLLQARIQALSEVVAERDHALATTTALADSLAAAVARSEVKLRLLEAESPVQALKRTLRRKAHDSRHG